MKNPTRSREELFTIEDDPEIMQLNFPPTEIEESQGCTFLPVDNNKLQYFLYPSNVSRRDYQYEIVDETEKFESTDDAPDNIERSVNTRSQLANDAGLATKQEK